MGMVRTIPRLQNLICPVDRVIAFGETAIDFCGVKLGVLRTPGHSPDHICVITPGQRLLCGGRPDDRGRAGRGHGPLRL